MESRGRVLSRGMTGADFFQRRQGGGRAGEDFEGLAMGLFVSLVRW